MARTSPDLIAAIGKAYPHASNEEVAARFGVTPKAVKQMAWRRKWHKSPEYMQQLRAAAGNEAAKKHGVYRDVIRQMAPDHCAAEIAAVLGVEPSSVRKSAKRMGIACKPGVRSIHTTPKPPKPPKPPKEKAVKEAKPIPKTGGYVPQEPKRDTRPVVGMDTAPRTVVNWIGYDPRYQVDPSAKVFGAGFSAAGIGRNIETGASWGAA